MDYPGRSNICEGEAAFSCCWRRLRRRTQADVAGWKIGNGHEPRTLEGLQEAGKMQAMNSFLRLQKEHGPVYVLTLA